MMMRQEINSFFYIQVVGLVFVCFGAFLYVVNSAMLDAASIEMFYISAFVVIASNVGSLLSIYWFRDKLNKISLLLYIIHVFVFLYIGTLIFTLIYLRGVYI